jgi:CheY-like chemotaxis protein
MPRLFQKFEQTESGRASKQGTGLGLAICREYVELMGGTISARSKPGEGSVFRFEIPLRQGEEPTGSPPERAERRVWRLRPGQPDCRVLVVDDLDDNRLLLTGLLEAVGFETRQAADGEQAFAAFAAWRPVLVMMDMRMPRIDGFEAIRRIRAAPGGEAARIICVSASAFDEDRAGALAAGADDFIGKPFRESVLFEKVRLLLGLEYEYADQPVARAALPPGELAPTRAAVARLPVELRGRLRQATVNADLDRMRALIGDAAAHDAEAARRLRDLAEAFAYRQLLDLLRPAEEPS